MVKIIISGEDENGNFIAETLTLDDEDEVTTKCLYSKLRKPKTWQEWVIYYGL